ncbi:small ribosomal subunit protein uS11m-like isoform X1 [Diadema setosum]|uniref:small ribosomal subunit protein uS11m-like isoform X1 n=2 Tax=Diadema setosum TaxID=31175 RepID=UPI003B3B0A03
MASTLSSPARMIARVLLRRCLSSSSHLHQRHRQSLLHNRMPPTCGSPIQPACSLLLSQGLHAGGPRLQQEDTTSVETSTTETLGVSTATDDAGEDTRAEEEAFENSFDPKFHISPSSTESLVFNGIPYDRLPIVYIKATYNNTHISVADYKGITVGNTSCGTEGFKNAKKGTAIAAQTAAIAAATKALDKNMTTVRVIVKGIGPGRQSSIKGLQMGGLDVVSITDNTPVPHNGCRPRKARRL